MYDDLGRLLKKDGLLVNNDMIEALGVYRKTDIMPLLSIPSMVSDFRYSMEQKGYPLAYRENMEKYHYGKLYNSLMHSLAENYFYLKENPLSSRRVIAVSSDCISVIQCKAMSDDTMGIFVFMRSSHYHNLLPVDLLFLFELFGRYIEGCGHICRTFRPEDDGWDFISKVEYAQLTISFGSLHTHRY